MRLNQRRRPLGWSFFRPKHAEPRPLRQAFTRRKPAKEHAESTRFDLADLSHWRYIKNTFVQSWANNININESIESMVILILSNNNWLIEDYYYQPVQWDGRAGSFSWLMAAPVDKVDLKTASTATRYDLLLPPRISHWLFQVMLRSSMNRKSWDSGLLVIETLQEKRKEECLWDPLADLGPRKKQPLSCVAALWITLGPPTKGIEVGKPLEMSPGYLSLGPTHFMLLFINVSMLLFF